MSTDKKTPEKSSNLLNTAEMYLDWMYYPEARKAYLEVLAQDPGRSGIHEALGYISLALQEYDDAIGHFIQELARQPENELPKLLMGLAHFQGGDEALAQGLLKEVSIAYAYMLGNPRYKNQSSYLKKHPFFRKFMADNPGLIPFARGMLFKKQGMWDKAMEMMKDAAKKNYCMAEVMVQAIDLNLQLGENIAAVAELSRLRGENSQLAEQMDDWVRAGDRQGALRFALSRPVIIRYFRKPTKQIIDQLDIMAQESVKRADPKSAFRTWEKAISIDEKRFELHYNLALIYCLYNFQKEALYHCRRAIELNDFNPLPKVLNRASKFQPWALNLAGNIEFQMGHYPNSLDYYQRALVLDGNYLKCRNNLGATYMKLGDAEHAEQEWRKVIRNSGKGEKEKEVQEVDEEEKIKVWVDVKESDNIIEASRSLAALYILQKRLAEAIPLLDSVLHFIPSDAEAHFMLGRIYKESDQPARARNHFQKAIKNGTTHEAEAKKLCLELDKMANKNLPKPGKKKR